MTTDLLFIAAHVALRFTTFVNNQALDSFVGSVVIPLAAMAWYFAAWHRRRLVVQLACAAGLLGLFGVGVDMLHQMYVDHAMAYAILGTSEDGGELLAGSAALWLVWRHLTQHAST